jgi:hypothetical protein
LIACGAIAAPCAEIVASRGWAVDVHPINPLLHNSPAKIAGAVAALADSWADRYDTIAVGYADCGTYGALDRLCQERGWRRLPGLHCYDVFAGPERLRSMFEKEPGTYLLTDFLVRSFHRTVTVELGLDRYPDLRDAYFGHYHRVVWLAQRPDAELRRLAESAADLIGLPLAVVETGHAGLEEALSDLVGALGQTDAASDSR